jgi:hypothetical protein
MPVKACYSTPLLHVVEIERSLKFYALLGFETVDTDVCQPIGWARMHGEGGAVMFLRAERPVDGSTQSFLPYMYSPNLLELREQLRASGIPVPPIRYPGYMPSGETGRLHRAGGALGKRTAGKLGGAHRPKALVPDKPPVSSVLLPCRIYAGTGERFFLASSIPLLMFDSQSR